MTQPPKNQNDLAVILVGHRRNTLTLRLMLEATLRKFADDYNLHVFVQESENYPSDEWEEGSECTLNHVGGFSKAVAPTVK